MKKIYLSVLLLTAGVWINHVSAATLNLKLFIQAYYTGEGRMCPHLSICSVPASTGFETDTITVELHEAINPAIIIVSAQAILMRDGNAMVTFPDSVIGKSCYVAVKTLNITQTWSSMPVTMAATTDYDFSIARSQAYGNNMIDILKEGVWSFYGGDLNQDDNVDILDYPQLDYLITTGAWGYFGEDLNCDLNVDLLDYPVYDINLRNGIFAHYP